MAAWNTEADAMRACMPFAIPHLLAWGTSLDRALDGGRPPRAIAWTGLEAAPPEPNRDGLTFREPRLTYAGPIAPAA